MENVKALISYKDWLLLNRGEVRPEIGDKITVFWDKEILKTEINEIRKDNKPYFEHNWTSDYDQLFVEIDYLPKAFEEGYKQAEYCYRSIQEIANKNHAVEFAKWMETPPIIKGIGGQVSSGLFSIEDYYESFKRFLNEKEIQQA